MYAAGRGHADCARLLIDAGADKDAKNNVRKRSRRMFHIDKFTFLAVYDMFTLFLYLVHGAWYLSNFEVYLISKHIVTCSSPWLSPISPFLSFSLEFFSVHCILI
jgi:hypothetical protein